jgi:hypothetical protein
VLLRVAESGLKGGEPPVLTIKGFISLHCITESMQSREKL